MTIIFDNTGFSVEYWGRFTESEFIEHGMQQKFFKQHPDDIRRELLKQVYQIMQDDPSRNAAQVKRL
jgi:hypothetical protein